MDDEVAPVLLVLAAPDELRVEVAVAPLVGDADRTLLRPCRQDRLVLGGRDVLPLGLVVRERLDGLRGLRASSWPLLRVLGPAAEPRLTSIISLNCALDLRLEVGLDLVDLGELGEGPAAVACRGG